MSLNAPEMSDNSFEVSALGFQMTCEFVDAWSGGAAPAGVIFLQET